MGLLFRVALAKVLDARVASGGWTLALAATIAAGCVSAPREKPEGIATRYASDARAMCELVPKVYLQFDTRAAHWGEACSQALAEAAAVTTAQQGTTMLEHLVEALWDHHASLGVNTDVSPWLVPSGSDMWWELRGAAVYLTGVRRAGAADRAGVRPGDVILSMNGLSPQEAARARIRTSAEDVSPERMAWALNAAGAGFRDQPRRLVLIRDGERITVELGEPAPPPSEALVSGHMIGDVGYIRFNDSLGHADAVAAFDAAVERMRAAKGWIIDVRDTPSGGSTDVAEPIMGRFVTAAAGYQLTQPLRAPASVRQIEPRGPWTLSGPLAVLAGRWTGSMGEGMAIGFDGMARGSVVGGPMAGLAGGVDVFTLPATDTDLRLPAYGLAHVDGTPRQRWAPKERVQPDSGGSDDPALARALQLVSSPQQGPGR